MTVVVQRVAFSASFKTANAPLPARFPPLPPSRSMRTARPVTRAAAQVSADGERPRRRRRTADDTLVLVRETATQNAMTGEVTRVSTRGTRSFRRA